MLNANLLLLTDSYKISHWRQYPPGTEYVYSYFESRGGMFPEIVFFGLEYFLLRYLQGEVVTESKIQEAETLLASHFGTPSLFHRKGWEYIVQKYNGRLPLRICAVPEGTVVPTHNVLMTVENTDPECFWLTNYIETLLVQTWYPSTVATLSRAIKQQLYTYQDTTGSAAGLDFSLHDFGFRGVSSPESAGLGGAAHLVNFLGTDTLAALVLLRDYYHSESAAGFSIPASEHSTITAWGKEQEVDAYRNLLTQFPSGLLACVSDSYDIFHACKELWGNTLKAELLQREGTLVIRPDSGNPTEVIVQVLSILGEQFGYTTNSKGYKVLPPQVRLIQGDGVNYISIGEILKAMKNAGWAAENIAFGMGGALLQQVHRDTQKFAFKCSAITRYGIIQEVFKQPITDTGKHSKRGKLALVRSSEGKLVTVPATENTDSLLQPVFENGTVLRTSSLSDIRQRAKL